MRVAAESSDEEGVVDVIASIHFPETLLADRRDSPQLAIAVYISNDTHTRLPPQRIKIEVDLPSAWVIDDHRNLRIIEISLSNDHRRGNPHLIWLKMGKPPFPDFNQSRLLRSFEAPTLKRIKSRSSIGHNRFSHEFSAVGPTVKLIHICRRSVMPPGRISGIEVIPLSPLLCENNGNRCKQMLMIRWKAISCGTKCILKYQLFATTHNDTETRNLVYSTESGSAPVFSHAVLVMERVIRGACVRFEVRAIDYFWRKGPLSNSAIYKFD